MQNSHPEAQPDTLLISEIIKLIGWSSDDMPTVDTSKHRGPRRLIFDWQIIVCLIAQNLRFHGCLAVCFMSCFGVDVSDTALCLRRQKMALDPFLSIMRQALRPLADEQLHPDCFFAGLRLVAIDGTQWSLINTPQVLAKIAKAATRRGLAAFAKLPLCSLVELGTHAPLGAAIGLNGESEITLCQRLWDMLPTRCLLLLDRLYGQAPMLEEIQTACSQRNGHFLVRVRRTLVTRVIFKLADGSAQVEVTLRPKTKKARKSKVPRKKKRTPAIPARQLQTREVQGRVWSRSERKWVPVRLWTSLSVEQASAEQLIALYARRWDHEVFYKALKLQINGGDLLQSHTPESAAQEVLAMLLACSLLAKERLAAAAHSSDPGVQAAGALRISFSVCHEMTAALWMVLQAAPGIIDAATQARLSEAMSQAIATQALCPRRQRSCGRTVRQPVKKWRRTIATISVSSPPRYEIIVIA